MKIRITSKNHCRLPAGFRDRCHRRDKTLGLGPVRRVKLLRRLFQKRTTSSSTSGARLRRLRARMALPSNGDR